MRTKTPNKAGQDRREAPVTIVILNWNGVDDTVECVDSLLIQSVQDFQVVLVDNGSDGDDADRLERRYGRDPRFEIRRHDSNLGFARGMNAVLETVLERGSLEHLVLLNNDTVLDRRWLEALLAAARESGAGSIASRMINYNDRGRLDNAGHVWLNTGEILPRGTGEAPQDYARPATLVGGCAGAMLYRVEMLRDIGLFDPYFDTGYEDAEMGLRAFQAGYPTFYCPQALVYHKVSRSIDKIRDLNYAIKIQQNINYTYLKLAPWPLILINAPFILIKTLGVLFTALLFLRIQLFRAHWRALTGTWRDLPKARAARRASARLRRIGWWPMLRSQHFFLSVYGRYFREYLLTGKKTVFER